MAARLSTDKCTLLAIHYASEGKIRDLQSLSSLRLDELPPELILRILLTYLPESIDPREYAPFVHGLYSDATTEVTDDVDLDVSPVEGMEERQARRKVKKLQLLETRPVNYPSDGPRDPLTEFVYHRAYRIDAETGLLNRVAELLAPFLSDNEFLSTWYLGTVLPLLRLQSEYPTHQTQPISLLEFDRLGEERSVEILMRNARERQDVVRGVRGLVGPWTYGHNAQKRRKLGHRTKVAEVEDTSMGDATHESLGDEWEHLYEWMVTESQQNFGIVVETIQGWDGPQDVDLGDLKLADNGKYHTEDNGLGGGTSRYAQATLASCYATESDTLQTVRGVHSVLRRLARLLHYEPPPDLEDELDALPVFQGSSVRIEAHHFVGANSLSPSNPLTVPTAEAYRLLQMLTISAYQLSMLSCPTSITSVAKLRLTASRDEQLAFLQHVLRNLAKGGTKRDDSAWTTDRARLLWLWRWQDLEDVSRARDLESGILGKVSGSEFEEEMLKAFIDTSCYDMAIPLYLKSTPELLTLNQVANIVLAKTMESYDGASNGNRTRGWMKKANDIMSAFRPYFTGYSAFHEASSLIAATHALSFYSLTLQHGIPFQPVSIRVSQDPMDLIEKVLEQNAGSYTHLDDLVGIAQNFVNAGLPQPDLSAARHTAGVELDEKRKHAESRVTFMAIQAALREDDFETAYSYIVSRLTPSAAAIEAPKVAQKDSVGHARNLSSSSARSKLGGSIDDMSWRAAFLAGRYRPTNSSSPSLRRLEQRTELLSLAILLAPASALTEILAVWRRCEEETSALQLAQQQTDNEMDDRADKRQSLDSLPGNFTIQGEQPALLYNQKRREMGRMTGKSGGDEAPVSMFDLTRSAAQAISKNAFPLRQITRPSSTHEHNTLEHSEDSIGDESAAERLQRTRKRDVVANAVSGGLASGLGWVLGATPVSQHRPSEDDDW